MSKSEIELTTLPPETTFVADPVVDTNSCDVKAVSSMTLFFRFSNKLEKLLLSLGIVFSIIAGVFQPFSYTYYGSLMNVLVQSPMDFSTVMWTLSKFSALIVSSAVFAFFERLCLSYFAEQIAIKYRNNFTKAAIHHDVEFIESISPGRLGQRYSEESSRIVTGLGPEIGLLIRSFSSLITGAIIGFYYSWQLTIIILIALPFVLYFAMAFKKTFITYYDVIMQEHQEADTMSEETFRNVKTIAALGAEEKMETRYNQIMENCRKRMLWCINKSGLLYGGMLTSNQLSYAMLIAGAILIIHNQRIHFPQLLFDSGCVSELSASVDVCFASFNLSDTCQTLCKEINNCWYHDGDRCLVGGEVMTITTAVFNTFIGFGSSLIALTSLAKSQLAAALFLSVIDHKDTQAKDENDGQILAFNEGDIVFSDIVFKYAQRDTVVLNRISLTIHDDEMLGIVGESGSGKSTILKLLMQLYTPLSGTITWNGTNTALINVNWLRQQIAYVCQEPVLFSGTIRENLLYGREGCTEQEMMAATKLVEADSFIRTFPSGYDTHVGKLGSSLSGGQKQRIAIARALIRRPRVLVLDEATSALDTQSETIVQRAIESIRQQNKASGSSLSIVIVAHRLSTIRNCDRIVVVEEGRVVEEGSHDALISRQGIYAGLYESQTAVTSATPIASITVEEEGKKNEIATEEEEKKKGMHEKEEIEIPDEIPAEQFRHISLFHLIKYIPQYSWMLWLSFFGNFLRVFFPPVSSYSSSRVQGLFYSFDLDYFWDQSWLCVYLIIGTTAFTLIGSILQWNLAAGVGEHLVKQLRLDVFSKYLSMHAAFFDDPKHFPSVLTARLGIDVRCIRDLIDLSGMIIENYLIAIVCLVLVFTPYGDWRLGILAVVMSPFIICIQYLQYSVISNTTERIDSDLVRESGIITDYLLNIHTVHAYGLENTLLESINDDMKETNRLTSVRMWRASIGQGLTQFMPCVYMITMLSVGAWMLNKRMISFERLLIVYLTVSMCSQMIGNNMAHMNAVNMAQKAANNIIATLALPNEDEKVRMISTEGCDGDITLKDVSFTYVTRSDTPVLRNVSLTIPQGKSVAFVGPSGCGKSTIIALLQRLYRPMSGIVSLAGQDVETLNLNWYRKQLGAVLQEPCMLSGTIRDNLQLGVDQILSEAELEEACRQALCIDFINEMPDRFETDLGATGKAVSGGQKQRLALARAILRKPSILLLDEATSALDSENQERFLDALKEWRKRNSCTVVTVAHRLSTIIDSDIIFVVHEGQVMANGSHTELLTTCGFYANLVRGQMEASPVV